MQQLANLWLLLIQQFTLQAEIDKKKEKEDNFKDLSGAFSSLGKAANLVNMYEKNLEMQRELIIPLINKMMRDYV